MLHNAIRLDTRKWMWNLEQPQESFFQSSHELLSIDKAVNKSVVCAFYYSVIMGVNRSRLKRNQNHNL